MPLRMKLGNYEYLLSNDVLRAMAQSLQSTKVNERGFALCQKFEPDKVFPTGEMTPGQEHIGGRGAISVRDCTQPPTPETYALKEEIEGLREYLQSEPAARLTNLIKKTGWYKGEVSDLTLKQYRDLTGKREIPPNVLTPDKEHVYWEYTLDDTATEMGYGSGDELKEAIESAGAANARIEALEADLSHARAEALRQETGHFHTHPDDVSDPSWYDAFGILKMSFKKGVPWLGCQGGKADKTIRCDTASRPATRTELTTLEAKQRRMKYQVADKDPQIWQHFGPSYSFPVSRVNELLKVEVPEAAKPGVFTVYARKRADIVAILGHQFPDLIDKLNNARITYMNGFSLVEV